MSVTFFQQASLQKNLLKGNNFANSSYATPTDPIPISKTNLLRYYTAQNIASVSGTTWTDLNSSGYDMTLTNGPIYTQPASSTNPGYISFDGSNDYAIAADTGMPTGSSGRSIGGWIYPISPGDGVTVLFYGTLNYNNMWWQADVTGRSPNPAMAVNFYGPWLGGLSGVAGVANPTSNWSYFCITWAPNGDYAFNYNGSNTRTGNQAGDVNTALAGNVSIAGGQGQPAFNCRIGEMFVYTSAISEATNTANYNATKAQYGL